jgi:hypothetical protein
MGDKDLGDLEVDGNTTFEELVEAVKELAATTKGAVSMEVCVGVILIVKYTISILLKHTTHYYELAATSTAPVSRLYAGV